MNASQKAEVDAELARVAIARRRAPRAARLADEIREFTSTNTPAGYLMTLQESKDLEWLVYDLDARGTFERGRMVDDITAEQETEHRAKLDALKARVA
jgi:hypothetical protein